MSGRSGGSTKAPTALLLFAAKLLFSCSRHAAFSAFQAT
jgi:hypothetical protein